MKPTIAAVVILVLTVIPASLLCAEAPPAPEAPADAATSTMNSASARIGAELLDVDDGGETLLPYQDTENHPVGFLQFLHFFPWNGILDISGTYSGEDYHDVKAAFDYRGDLLITVSSSLFPRNFEHSSLPSLPRGSGARVTADDLNPADRYRLDNGEQQASIRWRLPDYPAHLRLSGRRYEVEGSRQQVFADWSCTSQCHIVSQSRKVDSRTGELSGGADSHLGLFDASYSFRFLTFEDDRPDPTWFYGPIFGARSPGLLVHNAIPEIKSVDHLFTLSTSNTGRVAATLGVGIGERNNESSDVSLSYNSEACILVWRPRPGLAWYVNLNRRQIGDGDLGKGATALRKAANLPTGYEKTDSVISSTLTWSLSPSLRLRADASLHDIERRDVEEWELPSATTAGTVKLSAESKPSRQTTLNASVSLKQTDDPAYVIIPTSQVTGQASFSWQVTPGILLQSNLVASKSRNDSNQVTPAVDPGKSDRDSTRILFFGGLTSSLVTNLTTGAYLTLFNEDVTQDLIAARSGTEDADLLLFPARGSSYRAQGQEVTLKADWKQSERLTVGGEISYTRAKGDLDADNAGAFSDIGTFTPFKATEWEYRLNADYSLGSGWGLSLLAAYLAYDDEVTEAGSEIVRAISTVISKRW